MSTVIEEPETRIEVIREPLTYERHQTDRSYFKDLTLGLQRDNREAMKRLERHAHEVRVNPNRLDGEGGYFSPPLWANELFATAARPGRVYANELPTFPLPWGVSQVNTPRLTTGAAEGLAADLADDVDRDIVDTVVTSPVAPFSGQADVALQLLEQSPAGAHLDWLLFKDLTGSYDHQLELQLIAGTGGQELTGILNLPTGTNGVNAVTYTSGSPTATALYPLLGQAAAQIGDKRFLPPEAWIMTTSRAMWIASSEDTQNRPLVLSNRNGAGQFDLLTFPVLMSDAMPQTQGAGNQDAIVCCRPSDSILLETPMRTSVFLDVLSGTLSARLQMHGYAAVLHRYPTGFSVVSGTGMAVQSGF